MAKRKGFTLIEAIISVVILSIVLIALVRFDITATNNLIKSNDKADEMMIEYQDAMFMKSGELNRIQNMGNLSIVEYGNGLELFKYSGDYFECYRTLEE